MNRPEDHKTLVAMRKFGGGFVHGLAELMAHADDNNYQRLKNAFPEYFAEYSKIAETMREEEFE